MSEGKLSSEAWGQYAAEVRRDPANPYFCFRLLEKAYLFTELPDGKKLIRQAAITVYQLDPLAYVTSYPHANHLLSDADLKKVCDALVIEGDEDATNFLRGKLWADAIPSRPNGIKQAQRGLKYLSKVSEARAGVEPDYIAALAACCLLTDYDSYKSVCRALVDSRQPEWRGHELIRILEAAVKHEDWETYSAWRGEWKLLPANAHLCECNLNQLHTYDGLYDLQRGVVNKIPQYLRKAVDVRGCPHLNTGAASMRLIKHLIKRKMFLAEARAYVEACSNLCRDDARIKPMKSKIAAAMAK